jgi:BCD family chlorophyll transporter-like MFS transporter
VQTASLAVQRFLASILPSSDRNNGDLPFWRLTRLALFQVSCGMVAVLLTGTLNRVMIVELGMPGWIVAVMVAAPLVTAPFRALIGFKSDTHRSVFGWRRLPYVWFGSLLQFGGLAIMPFALLILSGTGVGPIWTGYAGAAVGFLLIGAGMHTVQTAGLALATDLATEDNRARVVAFHYVMLLIGMMISGVILSSLLTNFTPLRLIQVIQGAAVVALVLNVAAMWGQESRVRPGTPSPTTITSGAIASVDRVGAGSKTHEPNNDTQTDTDHEGFLAAWRSFAAGGRARRLLVAVALGVAAFNMADVVIEPYGGQILHLGVGATTLLTAIWALGALIGFIMASRAIARGDDAHRISGIGLTIGLPAFACVMLSAPLQSSDVFGVGAFLIGLGGGYFGVGTLTASMVLARPGYAGLAIGAWGAVQATAAGLAIMSAGFIRDGVAAADRAGMFGLAAPDPAFGYLVVFGIEVVLLLAALAVIGPLARFESAALGANHGADPGDALSSLSAAHPRR